jgi:hypothetical protein
MRQLCQTIELRHQPETYPQLTLLHIRRHLDRLGKACVCALPPNVLRTDRNHVLRAKLRLHKWPEKLALF